jgi:hypothetical protein
MFDLLTRDPVTLSPTTRRLAVLGARLACWISPLLLLGFLGASAAHFLFEVGSYTEPRSRYAVGSLFLFLFAPVTGAIWYLSRQRLRELRAAVDKKS